MNEAEILKKEINDIKNSTKKEGSSFFGRFFNPGQKPVPNPAPIPNNDYHDYTAEATKKRMADKLMNQTIDNKQYGNEHLPTTTSSTTSRTPPGPSYSDTKKVSPNMKNDNVANNDKSKVKLSEYEQQIMSEMLDATPGVCIYII
jgi:hypothetical protein